MANITTHRQPAPHGSLAGDLDHPENEPAPAPGNRVSWKSHLARLGITILVISAVSGVIARVRADDAPSATVAAIAPASSLAERVAALEATTRTQPDNAANWQELGQAYVQRSIQTLDPSFYDLARRAFDRVDVLAPGDLATVLGRAGLAATQHRFVEALGLAEQVLVANPYSAGALAVRVDAEIELGRYDAAETHLDEFLERKPGAAALARVSYLRELTGDLPGALQAIKDAETAAGEATSFERATLVFVRGDTLLAAGRFAEAGVAYQQALTLAPDLPGAVVGLARVTAAQGDRGAAIALLKPLVDRLPLPGAAMLLADLQADAGDTLGAKRSLDLVLATAQLQSASGADVELDLAIFRADHDVVDADSVAKARATYAARPSVYGADALAWTLFRSGDIAGAAATLSDVSRLGTVDSQLLFHRAAILDAVGDHSGATSALTAATRGDTFFSFARQSEIRTLAARLGVEWPTKADG